MIDEPAVLESPAPSNRTTAQWIQFPRRLLFLLLAYVVARLLLLVFPSFLPASASGGQIPENLIGPGRGNTLQLLVAAFFFALLFAALPILVGVLADRLEKVQGLLGSILKGAGRLIVFPTGSLPVIVIGTLFLILALRLGIGLQTESVIMPAITLALYPAMILAQAVARAFTLPRPLARSRRIGAVVMFIFANLFAQTAGLLSVSMVVEIIFNRPGLGRLLLQSFFTFEFAVSTAVLAVFLALVFWGRFIAEILRAGVRLLIGDAPPVSEEPTAWRRKARLIWVVLALVLLLLPAGIAATGLIIPAARTVEQDLSSRNAGPSGEHPFGTDDLGRDVLARAFKGAWRLLFLSSLGAVAALIISAPLGLLAGYLRNRRSWPWESLSDAILLLFDIWLIYPMIPLLITLVAVFALFGRGGIVAFLMAVIILPRGIRAAREMWPAGQEGQKLITRVGLLIVALFFGLLFTSFGVLLAVDFLGFLSTPPAASLGTNLQNAARNLITNPGAIYFNWLIILAITFPFYLAADAFIGFSATKEVMVRLNE